MNYFSRNIVLLLVGLDSAGKTTALKGLAGESTDNVIPSVGFSCTTLLYKGNNVKIYDLGGNKSIRGIWNKYFTDVHGVMFVVDASAVDRLDECSQELEKLLKHENLAGKPVLLLANKQDLPGALDELDLVENLRIEDLVNRQKCPTSVETSAAVLSPDPAIQNGFKWLLETILKNFTALDDRVRADTATQKLQEEKMLNDRLQRVEKLRKMRNGHAVEDENEEQDFNKNPFRPISELTAKDGAFPGTKMILVQQSPPRQVMSNDMGPNKVQMSSQDSSKSVESLPLASPVDNSNEFIKFDNSPEKQKKRGLFSRNNKTAPLPESSPVRKQVLPPLIQIPVNVTSVESVPWIKPVLSASASERRASAGLDRAWGLEQALEAVHPEPKMGSKLDSESIPTSTHLTELSQQYVNQSF